MRKILVSQCLYGGNPVRYDGKSKEETNEKFVLWKKQGRLIPICPEVSGGLPVPRNDAQRKGNIIVTRDGIDVTDEYIKGAQIAAKLARDEDIVCAIMKEKSPSCGSHQIYDGSFSGRLIEGKGLTVELLEKNEIPVFSEDEIEKVAGLLEFSNIVLIGMPASGKSVTGVLLAKAMGMNFIDTDILIQTRAEKPLQEIIDEEGIEVFKKLEEKVLCDIKEENTVIATGGSAIYYRKAMEHLKENGVVIYIESSLGNIEKRLKNIKTRGVAMGKDQTIDELYKIREPLYKKYADITVSTKDTIEGTVAAMVKEIILY